MQKDIIKKEIKKNYSKIALEESNPNSCCMPHEFNFDSNTLLNPKETLSNAIGYRESRFTIYSQRIKPWTGMWRTSQLC